MDIKYYTITALNKAIKNMFDEKRELNNIHLKGEISNFKHHTRGHLYFTLKDDNAQLKAVIFDNVRLCTEDEKKQILQIIEVIRGSEKK